MKAKLAFFALGLLVFTVVAAIQSTGPTLFVSGSGAGSINALNAGNIVQPPWSAVLAGRNNRILGTGTSNDVCLIAGGEDNLIALGNVKHAVILGGQSNLVAGGAGGARYGTIAGGWQNEIARSNTVVSGGWFNTNISFNSFLGGGYKNLIYESDLATKGSANVLAGGGSNQVIASYSALLGGLMCHLTNGASLIEGSVLCGGLTNINTVGYSFLGGGIGNRLTGAGGALVGGSLNLLSGDGSSFIGGGSVNTNAGITSAILGGTGNWVTDNGFNSSILAGEGNKVDAANAHVAGDFLTNTTANSVEVGANDTAKTRFDANGQLVLGAHAVASTAVTLTADNQSVSTAARSYIRLQSDNGTAGNRTFVLTQGSYTGQLVDIEWVGTNAGEVVDDSAQTGAGNHRLSATWTPTQYDVLSLRFNGTDWVERSRSAN